MVFQLNLNVFDFKGMVKGHQLPKLGHLHTNSYVLGGFFVVVFKYVVGVVPKNTHFYRYNTLYK